MGSSKYWLRSRSKKQTLKRNWKNLPQDLLLNIADDVKSYVDYFQLRAVCASWRSTLPEFPKRSHHEVPWLLLPYYTRNESVRGFYDPLNDQVFCMKLPSLRDQRCCGSSDGWLVTRETKGSKLRLFNPFTKSQLRLPPTSTFPHPKRYHPQNPDNGCNCSLVSKIVLSSSSSSSSNDFTAIAIHGEPLKLAFAKVGNDKWTPIPTFLYGFQDCISFKEKIYAINSFGDVLISPIDNPMQAVNVLQAKSSKIRFNNRSKLYLVSICDELVMVEKTFSIKCQTKFNLFKFEQIAKGVRWLEINNLDGYTLFLGLNTSICISSEYCPKLSGNQIYYTNHEFLPRSAFRGCDFDVFNITDGSCRASWNHSLPLQFTSQPIWVVLNP